MASNNTLGTVVTLNRESIGSQTEVIATVSVGTNYPTGGKPITALQFGLDSIAVFQVIEPVPFGVPTKLAIYDRTNAKLGVFVQDDTTGNYAEAADDTDQSLVVVSVRVRGY